MTRPAEEKTQAVSARLAGLLFILVFVTAFAGHFLIPAGIIVSGDFSATAQNMTASEQTYRIALSARVASSVLTIFLSGALYALLAPVSGTLALVALLSRTGEAVLGGVGVSILFFSFGVYTGAASAFSAGEQESLAHVLSSGAGALFFTSVVFFSVGSTLFFYLLYKSRYIPRLISLIFGVFGSLLVTVFGFAGLIVSELPAAAQYAWAPLAVAELGGGLWLLIIGANLKHWKRRQSLD
jgi:Domain of unknown function (DUF4386)